MTVLLINPNRSYPLQSARYVSPGVPLGLLYVAACLERNGIPVSVLDCLLAPESKVTTRGGTITLGIDDETFRETVLRRAPRIVGITSQFTTQWDNAAAAIRIVRVLLPEATIVLGGPHPTSCSREIMAGYPDVDYIVAGEGEQSFPQLVRAILAGRKDDETLRAISGLVWRSDTGGITGNSVRPIDDLDSLPLPAYHLVDIERLFELQADKLFPRSKQQRAFPMITSRGCPYTCVFCSIHLSMGRAWRHHSVEAILAHLKFLRQTYDIRHVCFEDDNFTFKRSRVRALFERMIDEAIGVTWETPNGVRADTLNDDLLVKAKASGCLGLVVAAESGDQTILDTVIKKKIKLGTIERAAELCRKHGIGLSCFFVIGFPGESKRHIAATMRYAYRLFRKYGCQPLVHVATPLPGTELAETARASGYLVREMTPANLTIASSVLGSGMISTPEFTPDDLRKAYVRLYYRLRLLELWHDPRQLLHVLVGKAGHLLRPFLARTTRSPS